MKSLGSVGTGTGKMFFSPVSKIGDGPYYMGPVLVMLVNPDVRINGLIAWATSERDWPLSAVILLSTPETAPYASFLEGVLVETLSPVEVVYQWFTIPGTYDNDTARYNYLFELFTGFLSRTLDRIIVDLSTNGDKNLVKIVQSLHMAATAAGIERFQVCEVLDHLISVPPYDRLVEGIDYSIRAVAGYLLPQKGLGTEAPRDETESVEPQKVSRKRPPVRSPRKEMVAKESSSEEPDVVSILFLSAEPTNAARLRTSEEFREIQEKINLGKMRDHYRLELPQLSLRPADITQVLLDKRPHFVHFSGHGMSEGSICFENTTGEMLLVQPDALALLFEQFADVVKCVVLNACYSEIQAEAISRYIEYVIGMDKAVGDQTAIAFATGFYQALGAGRAVEEAFKFGRVQVMLQGIPEQLTPVLKSFSLKILKELYRPKAVSRTVKEIASETGLDITTVKNQLNKLEAKGYVSLKQSKGERWIITEAGKKQLTEN